MSERKYRQRGYMNSGRDGSERRPAAKQEHFGPKTPQMPAAHTVSRCGGCGTLLPAGFDPWGRCPRCGFELHCCKQCAYFEPSARFECAQSIPARITPKDARNNCTFYAPRTTIERQTSPTAPNTGRSNDPRAAFESLFKK